MSRKPNSKKATQKVAKTNGSKISAKVVKVAQAKVAEQPKAKVLKASFRAGTMRDLIRSMMAAKGGATREELIEAVRKQFKTDISGHLNSKLATMRARFNVKALDGGKLHIEGAKEGVVS